MDCLDRTNVVQSVISRNLAHKQLFNMGLAGKPTGSPFEKFSPALEDSFRECWTDNANVISILYTGTPALKTDFTRTGKRTKQGALNDGVNSVKRYYINNYCDGYNHDCLDIC
jgi:phosphatidylinositol 4-phosphatase